MPHTSWMVLFRHPAAKDIGALYLAQFANVLVPLAALPYLARVLGPDTFGLLLFSQSFALWLAQWVEFGFTLSGTREIAQLHGNPIRVAEIVAGVQGAKFVLVLAATAGALFLTFASSPFDAHPEYLWLSLLSGAGQGLNPLWYFQGVRRLIFPAAIDASGKLMSVGAIFVLVHSPTDGWIVLALQAGAAFATTLVAIFCMHREIPFRQPRAGEVLHALRIGLSMFFFRGSVSLYTTANAFLLGLITAPAQVAFFGAAERLAKFAVTSLAPLSQALYPRLSALIRRDFAQASRLARLSLALMISTAILEALVLSIYADFWIELFLGAGYEQAVPVLRLLALLIPIIAASNVLGIQWMLPLRMDGAFNVIVISAAILNLALALLLANPLGAMGMAIAVLSAEFCVTVAMGLYILYSGRAFWRASRVC